MNKEFFEIITSVSREDLQSLGYDISSVSDETMEDIADKMLNDYMDQLYWNSLDVIASQMNLEKINN